MDSEVGRSRVICTQLQNCVAPTALRYLGASCSQRFRAGLTYAAPTALVCCRDLRNYVRSQLARGGAECSDVESTTGAGKGRAWRLPRILGAPFDSRIGRQTGMPIRIAGGTGWRSVLRNRRCESTLRGSEQAVTTHFISRGGPAKLYDGTKKNPCTSARETRSGRHEMRQERRSAQRTYTRFNKKSNGNEQERKSQKPHP